MGSTMSKKAEEGQTNQDDTTVVLDDEQTNLDGGEGNLEGQTDGGEQGEQGQTGEESDDVVVTIGEESPTSEEETAQAPEWVRELRKNYRELQREKRELEEKLKATTGAETKPATDPGKKPTLEACDYDAEKYEQDLAAWYERKR